MAVNASHVCLCDVTLSVYPHRAGLKNMSGHGGIRTYDVSNTSPMLWQLSYAVRSVRVCDISELNLVPSISVCILCITINFCDYYKTPFTRYWTIWNWTEIRLFRPSVYTKTTEPDEFETPV